MTPYTASVIVLLFLVILVNVNDVTRARRVKKKAVAARKL